MENSKIVLFSLTEENEICLNAINYGNFNLHSLSLFIRKHKWLKMETELFFIEHCSRVLESFVKPFLNCSIFIESRMLLLPILLGTSSAYYRNITLIQSFNE